MSCNLIQMNQGVVRVRPPGVTGQPTKRDQVRYLMHLDSNLVDATGLHSIAGSANYRTDTYKFPSASLDIRSTKVALNPSQADIIGDQDFTIEMWTTQYAGDGGGMIQLYNGLRDAAATPDGLQLYGVANRGLELTNGRDVLIKTADYVMPLPGWVHTAITRSGDTLTLWVGGQKVGTTNVAGWSIQGNIWHLGWVDRGPASGRYFPNYMDELRICLGVCVYTAPFTPPTAAFTLPPA